MGGRTQARIVPGDGDPRHGTCNGYVNLKCRCPGCKAGWATYKREWMNAVPARLAAHAVRQRARYRRKADAISATISGPVTGETAPARNPNLSERSEQVNDLT